MSRDLITQFDIDKHRESSWISCINAVMSEGRPQFINIIEHKYTDTFFEIPPTCKFICHTSKDGGLVNFMREGEASADIVEYLYTLNLQQQTYGNSSADIVISRTVHTFFELYGYMDIDLHIVRRPLKSQGELQISIAVFNRDKIIRL